MYAQGTTEERQLARLAGREKWQKELMTLNKVLKKQQLVNGDRKSRIIPLGIKSWQMDRKDEHHCPAYNHTKPKDLFLKLLGRDHWRHGSAKVCFWNIFCLHTPQCHPPQFKISHIWRTHRKL